MVTMKKISAFFAAALLLATLVIGGSTQTAVAAYAGCPTGAVTLNPGANIATAASGHATNTVFCLNDGTYSQTTQISPQSGQQFWAAHYRAAKIDGGYATAYAFASSAVNVQLHGLVVTRYKPGSQHAAIGGAGSGSGWLIQDCQVSYNGDWFSGVPTGARVGGAGVHGNSWTVTRSLLDHNGEEGYALGGIVTFTDNEVAWNNTSHQDWGFEAGGGKFWSTKPGTVITGNYVHDNDGPGLWIDSSSSYAANGYTMSGNEVDDNNGPGIDIEVSKAGTVSNNTLRHNGAYHSNNPSWGSSEITDSQTDGLTVTGNKMYGGAGLTVRDEGRSGYPCACNLHASGNTTIHETGWSNSFVTNANFPTVTGVYNSSGDTTNSWDYDTYVGVGSTSAWFRWTGTLYTFAGWQGKGQDVHGSLSAVAPSSSPPASPTPSPTPSPSIDRMTMVCTRPNGGPWTCVQQIT